MRVVKSMIKRGDDFIGRIIEDKERGQHFIQIEVQGEIVHDEAASINDEEQAEFELMKAMDMQYRKMNPKHPAARRT